MYNQPQQKRIPLFLVCSRNQTQKTGRMRAGAVDELMFFIGHNQEDLAHLHRVRAGFIDGSYIAVKNNNFMLERVRMKRRMAAGA